MVPPVSWTARHEERRLQVHDQAVDLPVLEGLDGSRVVIEDLGLDGRAG